MAKQIVSIVFKGDTKNLRKEIDDAKKEIKSLNNAGKDNSVNNNMKKLADNMIKVNKNIADVNASINSVWQKLSKRLNVDIDAEKASQRLDKINAKIKDLQEQANNIALTTEDRNAETKRLKAEKLLTEKKIELSKIESRAQRAIEKEKTERLRLESEAQTAKEQRKTEESIQRTERLRLKERNINAQSLADHIATLDAKSAEEQKHNYAMEYQAKHHADVVAETEQIRLNIEQRGLAKLNELETAHTYKMEEEEAKRRNIWGRYFSQRALLNQKADLKMQQNVEKMKKNIIKALEAVLNKANQMANKIISIYSKMAKKIAAVLNKLRRVFLNVFNLALIGAALKKSVDYASNATEIENVVEVAFGNMSDAVDNWASNTILKMGLAGQTAKKYASTIGMMLQSSGVDENSSFVMGTNLTQVLSDLASLYNYDYETVYQSITSGVVSGLPRAMYKFGIQLTETNMKAYALSKGIKKAYREMTAAEKVVLRYNYTLEHTRKVQGDFVRTGGTWANQVRIFKQLMIELGEVIGQVIVSVLNPLLQKLNLLIMKFIQAAKSIRTFVGHFFDLQKAAGGGGDIFGGMMDQIEDTTDAVDDLSSASAKLTDGPFSELHKLGDDKGNNAVEDLGLGKIGTLFDFSKFEDAYNEKTPLDIWLDGLIAKIEAFKKSLLYAKLGEWWQSLKDLLKELWGLIVDIGRDFKLMFDSKWAVKFTDDLKNINESITKAIKKFRDAWNAPSGKYGIVNKKEEAGAPLEYDKYRKKGDFSTPNKEHRELTWGEVIADTIQSIIDKVLELIKNLTDLFSHVEWEEVLKKWSADLEEIDKWLGKLNEWLGDEDTQETGGGVLTFLLTHIPGILGVALAIKAVVGAVELLIATVKNWDIIKKIFSKIGLLKAKIEYWVPYIGKWLIGKIGSIFNGIITYIQTLFETQTITGAIKTLLGDIVAVFVAWEGAKIIWETIKEVWDTVKSGSIKCRDDFHNEFLLKIPEKVSNFILDETFIGQIIKTIVELFVKLATAIGDAFSEHIWPALSDIGSKISGWVEETWNKIKGLFDDIDGKTANVTVNEKRISTSDFKNKKVLMNADGGYYRAHNPKLAVIGEGSKNEIVAPEQKISEAVASGISKALGNISNVNNNNNGDIVLNVSLFPNEAAMQQIIIKSNEINNYRTGR